MTDVSETIKPILQSLSKDSASLLKSVQSVLPADSDLLEANQGPSLLTLKNATLLGYLHHLVLLCSQRLRGRPLNDENGSGLVRNLIELRLILEKIRPVEGRMRGLVERLVRAAEDEDKRIREGRTAEATSATTDEVDPLSFRPNLAALSSGTDSQPSGKDARSNRDRGDGIYRPPRMAPVVYNPESTKTTSHKGTKERVAPRNAALLSDLSASMSANPYETSSGGVGVGGGIGASSSSRAKALARMQEYEEDNFTRLIMSKRDAKRRRRDEEDVALGGAGRGDKRGRVGAGLEEEFGDLLRNRNGDDYKSAKRSSALQRSRNNQSNGSDDFLDGSSKRRGGGVFEKKARQDFNKRNSKGRK
ncbi:hypothetical protein L7F22_039199 [Adiantum nelumboides]|nr:hypothetical protein [Adiantum nelumboides]